MGQMKPGPEATGYVIMPPAGGGGIPCAIQALTTYTPDPTGAPDVVYNVATVVELGENGAEASQTYENVYIIPDPTVANVGDKGFMTKFTPVDSTVSDIRYIQLSKGLFIKY